MEELITSSVSFAFKFYLGYYMPTIKSETTNDEIEVTFFRKNQRCFFQTKWIDDAVEHLKLVNEISEMLKNSDIKWVELALDFKPEIPFNTVSYRHINNFICHIEDFERFYSTNCENFVKINLIYLPIKRESKNGWTTITDMKKDRWNKFNQIKNDLISIMGSRGK